MDGNQTAVAVKTDAEKEERRALVRASLKAEGGYVVPTDIDQAFRYAQAVVGAGLAPSSYETAGEPDPQKVMIGLLKAMEVGLPPLTGLSQIAIINNRPCIWGDGAVALVQGRGLITKMESVEIGPAAPNDDSIAKFDNDYGYEVRICRKGQEGPYIGRFTVSDAKRSHLWGNPKKQPWMLYPKRMLFNRARAFALRDGFADALSGLAIREEVEDLPAAPPATADTSYLDDEPKVIGASRTADETPEPTGGAMTEDAPSTPGTSADGDGAPPHRSQPPAASGGLPALGPKPTRAQLAAWVKAAIPLAVKTSTEDEAEAFRAEHAAALALLTEHPDLEQQVRAALGG